METLQRLNVINNWFWSCLEEHMYYKSDISDCISFIFEKVV